MHFAHVRHIFFIAVFAAGGVMLEFCNVINYKKQNMKFYIHKNIVYSTTFILFFDARHFFLPPSLHYFHGGQKCVKYFNTSNQN